MFKIVLCALVLLTSARRVLWTSELWTLVLLATCAESACDWLKLCELWIKEMLNKHLYNLNYNFLPIISEVSVMLNKYIKSSTRNNCCYIVFQSNKNSGILLVFVWKIYEGMDTFLWRHLIFNIFLFIFLVPLTISGCFLKGGLLQWWELLKYLSKKNYMSPGLFNNTIFYCKLQFFQAYLSSLYSLSFLDS